LTYVHLSLQPRIDDLFARAGDGPITGEVAAEITALRGKRKRFASVCLFVVLIEAMLGVQVWVAFSWWLTLLLVGAIGAFTWRAYRSQTPYGWV